MGVWGPEGLAGGVSEVRIPSRSHAGWPSAGGRGWRLPPMRFIPFSAFWLRSCVVSVLISLIAYMVLIENLRLTSIFQGGGPMGSLLLGPAGMALVLHYHQRRPPHPNEHSTIDVLCCGSCRLNSTPKTRSSVGKLLRAPPGLSTQPTASFDLTARSRGGPAAGTPSAPLVHRQRRHGRVGRLGAPGARLGRGATTTPARFSRRSCGSLASRGRSGGCGRGRGVGGAQAALAAHERGAPTQRGRRDGAAPLRKACPAGCAAERPAAAYWGFAVACARECGCGWRGCGRGYGGGSGGAVARSRSREAGDDVSRAGHAARLHARST
jgi:hypothetical protein